jgi:beta-lactamase regulating signal transducer with metallopeptidase domain
METLQNIFQMEIIQRLGWTLVHFVWQAAAIALVLAIALKLLRKSSANLRYTIGCMALLLIVLIPAITIRMIGLSVPAFDPVKLNQAAIDRPEFADVLAAIEMPQAQLPAAVAPRVSLKDRFIGAVEPALPYVVVGWLVGVFGLDLKAKMQQLSNMLGIRKAIGLVESALVQVPTVVGHLKPVILLPASALTGLSPEQIEAILAHELAHIKRCDYLVNMLQTVVEILGFYHPAVWWVSHKVRVERENCCDDIAISLCSDSLSYARALTTMEEIRFGQPALAVAASGGSLFDRIRRLLGKDSANEVKLSWLPSAIAILLIIALLIPMACNQAQKTTLETPLKDDSKASHIPSTSIINEQGHIVDKIDYPFVTDPEVIGGWKSVDFVEEIDSFDPTKKSWQGDLFLNHLIFEEGGRISGNLLTWTKGLVFYDNDTTTASK